MGTGCYHAGAFLQVGHNFTNATRRERLQGYDGFSAFRQGRTPYKIHLSADTRKVHGADGISTNLSGQIDFNGTVDGGDFGVLTDDRGVIHVSCLQKGEQGIVINEVVQPTGSGCRRRVTTLPGCLRLFLLFTTPDSISGISPSENISV